MNRLDMVIVFIIVMKMSVFLANGSVSELVSWTSDRKTVIHAATILLYVSCSVSRFHEVLRTYFTVII
jgi:hypothetical protein